MELGNIMFGHSRGEFPVVRDHDWEEVLAVLLDKCGLDGYALPGFENEVFALRPYYWGDCTCGAEENHLEEHLDSCPCVLPNFHYKPTDYRLMWYKYPLRDSYQNQNIDIHTFKAIVDVCADSTKS